MEITMKAGLQVVTVPFVILLTVELPGFQLLQALMKPSTTFGLMGRVMVGQVVPVEQFVTMAAAAGLIYLQDFPEQLSTLSGTVAVFFGPYYPGSNCIWLAGSGGTIYFSPNGGGTWIDQSPGGGYDYDLNDILVIDGLHGICVGNNGVIWVTYDGGTTWVPWSSGTDEDLLSCELIDCVFHITSASGKVYKVDLGLQPVAPEISADGPLNTCSADTLTLSVVNPRVGYTYQWSDGTVGYSTIADQPTDYWVREIGYCGEINSDTLQVTIEFATLWYADTDGDTYGDPDAEFATCDLPPPGYVSNSDDCDDTDPLRTTYCPPPCFGDFNNDQLVNAADVLILLAALNPNYCGEACVADANGDGYVSTADLLLLLAYYGTPCPI
jgi:hypothetical protein